MKSLVTTILDDQYTHWMATVGHTFKLGEEDNKVVAKTLHSVTRNENHLILYFGKKDEAKTIVRVHIQGR